MKKFLKFFIFLLIVPLVFSLGACKKKKKNDSNTNGNQQEQPIDPAPGEGDNSGDEDPENPDEGGEESPDNPENPDEGGGDNPDEGGSDNPDEGEEPEDPPVTPQTYSVVFDYALPEGYKHLIENSTVSKETDETVALPTISDLNLQPYFLGWFNKSTNAQISSNISYSDVSKINVFAKWNETNLKKYYYTEGLTFAEGVDYLENPVAVVTGFTASDTTVVLPKVVEISDNELPVRIFGENCFKNSNVTKVINSNMEGIMIEKNAFQGSKLSSFDFSKVYFIGDNAFDRSKLTTINLGLITNSIGNYAFANSSITSIDFTKATNINIISSYMFYNAQNLSSVKFNGNISEIENFAFAGCASLAKVDFLNKTSIIGNNAFASCLNLKEVNIPNSIETFGYNIFVGCLKLEKITMAKMPTYNNYNLQQFMGTNITESVKSITITDESVNLIVSRYFEGLTNLETLVLPNSISAIGAYAFSGCVKLANFSVPTSLDVDNFRLNSVTDTLWYKNLTDILYFNNGEVLLLAPAGVSGQVIVKNGTKIIKEKAFANNSLITSITIPSSVEEIGASAFENCTNLTTINFETNNKLTELKSKTFYGCSKLSSINLINCTALQTIKTMAFSGLAYFSVFELPSNLITLETKTFANTYIGAYKISEGNQNYSTYNGVLYNKDKTNLISYPNCNLNSSFTTPTSVSHIEDFAFAGVKYLNYLYVTNKIITFGNGGITNIFSGYETSSLIIFVENKNLIWNDSSIRIPCYIKLDELDFEWSDLSDISTLSVVADPSTFNLRNCFVKFTIEQTEYFYRFTATIVSGETSKIEISNLQKVNI